jgi:broad specificity phosphatase PhoE
VSGPARLLLIRHAEVDEAMRERVFGRLDVELSDAGRGRADRLVHALASESIADVYSSPLRRALDTAAPLCGARGLEPVVVDDLRELDFGDLEGLTLPEIAARFPEVVAWATAPAAVAFPGGESVAALQERAVRAVRGIAGRHAGETAAVFAHAVVIRAVLADALAMPLDALFRLDPSHGGISVVEWHDGRPLVRTVNAPRL